MFVFARCRLAVAASAAARPSLSITRRFAGVNHHRVQQASSDKTGAARLSPAELTKRVQDGNYQGELTKCVQDRDGTAERALEMQVQPKKNDPAKLPQGDRTYHWITEEAETLIARAYNHHRPLALDNNLPMTSISTAELEALGAPMHFPPVDLTDRIALGIMKSLRVLTHLFFRERYGHHAVVLETVAAVPGIVGAFHRHLRSLRGMHRDHGWINPLQEEAENERMHLLIWMFITKPTRLERWLVLAAQFGYLISYSALYAVSGRAAHRLVGYLEEEAHCAYTDYLKAVDAGKLENTDVPDFAKRYYNLPDSVRLRDIILHVRADECMHRDFNHHLADKYLVNDLDSEPSFMKQTVRENEGSVKRPRPSTVSSTSQRTTN